MAAIGGAPESVTLDGREMPVAADADVSQSRGGYNNENQPNGNGTARLIKRRALWKLEGVTVAIDRGNDDLGYLQELANRLDFFPITITYADGVIYQGIGQLEGEVVHSTGSATASITIMGQGELTPQ